MFRFLNRRPTPAVVAELLTAQAPFPDDISLTGEPLQFLPVAGLTSAEWHAREADRYADRLALEALARTAAAYRATPLRSRLAAQYALALTGSHVDTLWILKRMQP